MQSNSTRCELIRRGTIAILRRRVALVGGSLRGDDRGVEPTRPPHIAPRRLALAAGIENEVVDRRRTHRLHRLREFVQIRRQSPVTARLEQSRCTSSPARTRKPPCWENSCRSTPAENEIGISGPTACRNTSASTSVITCSGGPDRYMTFSFFGKKSRWLSTSSVLENFAPNDSPRDAASSVSRPHMPIDSSNMQAAGVRRRIHDQLRVPQHVVQQMLEPLLAEHRRIHLHDRVDAHLHEQKLANPLDLRPPGSRGTSRASRCG